MKGLPFAVAVVALLIGILAVGLALTARDDGGPATSSNSELLERIAELEARVAELERRGAPRARRRDGPAAPAPRTEAPRIVRPPAAPAGQAPDAASPTNSRLFLDGWVRSHAKGGQGSEFFRLAVEAFAPELLPDLRAYLADSRQPDNLRVAIATMLSTPQFKDDPAALEALENALRNAPGRELAEQAVKGLAQSGDPGRAVTLEAIAITMVDPVARSIVIRGIAVLAGEGANAALLRMLARETSDVARSAVVESINTGDEEAALEILRQASYLPGYPVRNRAAEKLGSFRSDAAKALLEDWFAREEKHSVRARLSSARSAQKQIPQYDAQRAAGPADVPNPSGDHQNAWCPKSQNGGREWLELIYDDEIAATHVRVHEVYTPGAVTAVEVMDLRGTWRTGWEGTDPLEKAGVFEIELRDPGVRVKSVRVILDTALREGWHEIDAVELVGPDKRAWAAEVKASSTWGQ